MGKIKVDYIIVGQGLAGSWLVYEMLKRDLSVMVFDKDIENTSSKKASGIYNPITGRNMVKTWRADDLFNTLEANYIELEGILNSKFLHPIPIYRPFKTVEEQNDWNGKAIDKRHIKYLKEFRTQSMNYTHINDPLGGITLNRCGYVDIPKMLDAMKIFLINRKIYRTETFDYNKIKLDSDIVSYKDIKAKKIILCEGSLPKNQFWDLPFRPVRGEIIDIKCDVQFDIIINQGVFMIPKKDRITIGSTYDHENLTFDPQDSGIKSLKKRLRKLFKGEYEIIHSHAGVRSTTHDRKPYIGLHKKYKTLAIFNGFGTKGVSLVPYFAKHFTDVLLQKNEIDKEVHVQRVN